MMKFNSMKTPAPKKEQPIISFATPAEWRTWLEKHHPEQEGIWLRFFKKDSGVQSVNYAQALDEALCYGWIDGQTKKYDAESWLQKYTPRRTRSMWSKRNTQLVARLIAEKKMMPAGLKEIERAKADGRWDKAYDSPGKMAMPEDFLAKLAKDKQAQAFFDTLSKANTYAIGWRLQSAKKPETRAKRMEQILEMLKNGEKFH